MKYNTTNNTIIHNNNEKKEEVIKFTCPSFRTPFSRFFLFSSFPSLPTYLFMREKCMCV